MLDQESKMIAFWFMCCFPRCGGDPHYLQVKTYSQLQFLKSCCVQAHGVATVSNNDDEASNADEIIWIGNLVMLKYFEFVWTKTTIKSTKFRQTEKRYSIDVE